MASGGRRSRSGALAVNRRGVALRGVAVLSFGLAILLLPGLILAVLGLLFGLYALVDGTLTFVPALVSSDRGARRWLPLAEGATGIIAGLVALLWPGLTATALLYVVAAWAVLTGVFKALAAVVMGREVEGGRPMILGGALSVLFGLVLGVALTVLPGVGLPSLARLVGALAVVVGLAMIAFALRGRRS